MKTEFVISGLGGQGVLFLTRLISLTADIMNLPFIGSEVHGMSQRGGSVVSHLKIGNFSGPLVREGRAHILFSLEESEAYRNLVFLRPEGKLYSIVSDENFPSLSVKNILEENKISLFAIDKKKVSQEFTSSLNLLLFGFYAGTDDKILRIEAIKEAIGRIGSGKVIEKNLETFQKGIEYSHQLSALSSQ